MKKIYMMRHGRTLFNEMKKIQGWCDSPLTEEGINQAKRARKYLEEKGIVLDEAYSSTSERCCDTLELVTDLPYKRIKGLKEWNFGKLEGESEYLNPPLPYLDFFKQFGGETQDELKERINKTVSEITKNSEGDNILIVTHGAALANFYRYYKEYAKCEMQSHLPNCSIFTFEYEDGIFSCVDIYRNE